MLESRVQFLSEDRALSSRKGLCMYVAVRGFISIGNFSPQMHPIGGKALSQYYHFIVIILFFQVAEMDYPLRTITVSQE